MQLCKYSNMFGAPRTGVHATRIADIAVIDLALTVVAAYWLSLIYKQPFYKMLFGLLLLGIVMHRIFCVNTKVNVALFGIV